MFTLRGSNPFIATAAFAILSSSAQAVLVTPYTEDFSGATASELSSSTNSLTYNDITYSVDGTGKIGIFDLPGFLGNTFDAINGLGILGDAEWFGDTTNGVHNFTVSSNGVPFRLASLNAVAGDGGPPTIFTITAFIGAVQTAQVTGVNLATRSATNYAELTDNAVGAVYIGPEDGNGYGQSLTFTGSGWQSVDRIVFTSAGNDMVLGLDDIQFANPVPEPSTLIISLLGMSGALVRRRR
ncbi:MAG: PEP-CTERM sorting domain-containing protein [Verrucomicrobiaceae bacterium]|nr:MAG: PEP-CTERM sorting domain-containing protein [Verrucomicrobiaceae bacterium]